MPEEKKVDEAKKERIQIRDVTAEGPQTKELRFTKRFVMDWLDDDDVKQTGEFVIKRPTLAEEARIGVLCAELREDKPLSSLDRITANLNEWIAVCQVCVTQAPPWFKPSEMFDAEPVSRAYLEVLAFKQSFRKGVV